MTKKILMTTVALVALSGTAFAADLPSRRAPPVYIPPPAIPVFTWTGVYIGGHVGYEFGRSNGFAYDQAGVGLAAAGASPKGIIGGAHIGYNYQIPGMAYGAASGVVGLEGDVDGASYKSSYALGGFGNSTSQPIQGSVRGRLGVAVDRALFYATGGVAFGDLKNTYINTFNGLSDSYSHTKVGYTVGAGVEYAISNNWSVRGEYRYTNFGSFSDNLAGSSNGGLNVRHRESDNRVQVGVSYKFDMFSAAPVVARY